MLKRKSFLSVLTLAFVISSCSFCFAESASPQALQAERVICYSCFWQHQPEGLKEKIIDFYKKYRGDDFFLKGEASYMLANMTQDESLLEDSAAFYSFALMVEKDPFRKMLLNEIMGMIATHVSLDPAPYFREAAKLSGQMGMKWRARIFKSLASGRYTPHFRDVSISKNMVIPPGSTHFILGETAITIRKGMSVGVQVERTFRDWLSCQFTYDFSGEYLQSKNVLDYHEGARLLDLMEYAGVAPVVLLGTIIAERDGKWYAPDETGTFRFLVLNDKVQYPTTKQYGNIALMIDTHGVSAIVEQAIRQKVDLVIACGDNPSKAEAAYYLARKGIDVYFPCDREIGMLVGHDAEAVILGTAPIRESAEGAIIGNQPVAFSIDEKIVIQDIEKDSVARYYDSASRYFHALNVFVPLNLHIVTISGLSETYKVIEEAKRLDAKAVGIRVYSEEDYQAVKEWLIASKENRAVLFHSAAYEPGYRLFFEFPDQVTFGDPRPRFTAKEESTDVLH